MKRLLVGLVALFGSVAQAAVPIVLPPGQKAAEWAEALATRGLEAGVGTLPTAGAGVLIVDGGDHWVLRVRDWKGVEQSLNVSPCTNAQEREDLLFLVSTMVGKAPEAPLVVAAAPKPVPVAPAPVPVAPAPVPVAPAPVPVAPAPVPVAPAPVPVAPPVPAATTPAAKTTPPAPAPKSEPVAKAPTPAEKVVRTPVQSKEVPPSASGRTGVWLSAGGGVGIRPEAGVAGDIRIDGGWHVLPAVRVGLGVAFRTPAALPAAGEQRVMNDFDVVIEGAWVSGARIAPYAGAYGGLASRSFTDVGTAVSSGALPILGAEAGVIVPLGALPLAVAPSLRLQGDLRPIDLVAATGTTRLSPVEVRAGVMLVYRPM